MIGLFKTEVIRQHGSWQRLQDVEWATWDWVDWFNNRRLLSSIGDIPPAEAEVNFYATITGSAEAAWLKPTSLQ